MTPSASNHDGPWPSSHDIHEAFESLTINREIRMKPAYTVPIIILFALSGCSREVETREAVVRPHEEIVAAGDTDALPADDAKPAEDEPSMRSPVGFD
jgi:hypothetical protein